MPRVCRRWTAAEDALLRAHYAARGLAFCCARLGRTPGSVGGRALALGLRRRGPPRAHAESLAGRLRAPLIARYADRAARRLPLFA